MNDRDNKRPDPDKLLHEITQKENKEKKGKLKIFFGMCAGVGKTYSMLQAAHKAKKDGLDVVIGFVETHKRVETEALVAGLEQIPLKDIDYRESIFKEMDIDAIIQRKPKIVLVDELAHTNIPGSKHVKRSQDVLELLDAGIGVYTTVNVQHLESRAETVRQITGTTIRETVPDSILERADEIELADITPEELLQRLSEGKVYTPEKSTQAIKNFFRKGNLTALREMALRLTAERVDYQLRDYMIEKKIEGIWKSGQRLMVAIGPSPYSAELIRWTRRLAYTMEATWIAVYVESDQVISEENKESLSKNFALAKELGAEIIITNDTDIVSALIRVAKEHNVTQLIIGKTRKQKIFHTSDFTKALLKNSGDIDVYIVGGEREAKKRVSYKNLTKFQTGVKQYFLSLLLIAITILGFYFVVDRIGYQTVSIALILLISLMPLLNFGRGPIIVSACISALLWNFLFIPPSFTFRINKVEDIAMFFLFFIVAIVNGVLTSRLRLQGSIIRLREQRTNALYNLSKELSASNSLNDVADVIVRNMKREFDAEVLLMFSNSEQKLSPTPHSLSSFTIGDSEWHIANWAFMNRQKAGKYTTTLPNATTQYIPLPGSRNSLGVIGIKTHDGKPFTFEQETLLQSFVTQITTTVEREIFNEMATRSLVESESEKLYKTIFNSISHELKTPITSIKAAVDSMDFNNTADTKSNNGSLFNEIRVAAARLNRLVDNLLDMTRLESGQLKLKLSWGDMADLTNSILNRVHDEASGHKINIEIKNDVPIFRFDFGLLEQAIINIVRNAIAYTPEKTPISIIVKKEENLCVIDIADKGAGIPEHAIGRLFEKFYRVPGTKTGGTGLGLSITKGFVEAHEGTITVKNKEDGGALFRIKIPMRK